MKIPEFKPPPRMTRAKAKKIQKAFNKAILDVVLAPAIRRLQV